MPVVWSGSRLSTRPGRPWCWVCCARSNPVTVQRVRSGGTGGLAGCLLGSQKFRIHGLAGGDPERQPALRLPPAVGRLLQRRVRGFLWLLSSALGWKLFST